MGDITLREGLNELNVTLTPVPPPLATLYGVVTDAETGAPLAGVSVSLWDPAETELLASTTTDSYGSYRLENILPGNYVIYFSKENYETVKM